MSQSESMTRAELRGAVQALDEVWALPSEQRRLTEYGPMVVVIQLSGVLEILNSYRAWLAALPPERDEPVLAEVAAAIPCDYRSIHAGELWVEKLEAVLAEAREDTARMDWLEHEKDREERHFKCLALFRRNSPITRAAIDAARKAAGDAE